MPDGIAIDYDRLIPNNVGLADDLRVRKWGFYPRSVLTHKRLPGRVYLPSHVPDPGPHRPPRSHKPSSTHTNYFVAAAF